MSGKGSSEADWPGCTIGRCSIVDGPGESTSNNYRLKPDFWTRVAEELNMPWQACEHMHWAIGEQDMAQRANGTLYIAPKKGQILESKRTPRGPDLTPLPSPFTGVDSGGGRGLGHGYGHGIFGYPKQNTSGHCEARDEKVGNEDTIEGPKQPGDGPSGKKRKLPGDRSGDGPGARKKKVARFETGPAALAAEEKYGGCDGSRRINSKQENTGPAAAKLTSDESEELRALGRRLRKRFGLFDIV